MSKRADLMLVELGHYTSRARAQAAIAAGRVHINGSLLTKASTPIAADARVEAAAAHAYVSRGGVKLAAALEAFALDPSGLPCLDIGASTGGFTDVLLARGALSVDAVDVGHGQFSARLAADPRVRALEGLDARKLTAAHLRHPPQAIVCDVSFISQRLIWPHVLPLAAPQCWLVTLIKPQFEAGRENLVKGAVKDPAIHAQVCAGVRDTLSKLGWEGIGLIPSPISGGDGAREFLYAARHGPI